MNDILFFILLIAIYLKLREIADILKKDYK